MRRLTPDRYEVVSRGLRYLAWVDLAGGAALTILVLLDVEARRRSFIALFAAVTIPAVWAALLAASYLIELMCETLDEMRDRGD